MPRFMKIAVIGRTHQRIPCQVACRPRDSHRPGPGRRRHGHARRGHLQGGDDPSRPRLHMAVIACPWGASWMRLEASAPSRPDTPLTDTGSTKAHRTGDRASGPASWARTPSQARRNDTVQASRPLAGRPRSSPRLHTSRLHSSGRQLWESCGYSRSWTRAARQAHGRISHAHLLSSPPWALPRPAHPRGLPARAQDFTRIAASDLSGAISSRQPGHVPNSSTTMSAARLRKPSKAATPPGLRSGCAPIQTSGEISMKITNRMRERPSTPSRTRTWGKPPCV